ncbi:tRNA dimethylallyltransferase [Halorhodospira halochloris]|uniref:tRNA dimethylallyltransferase n=1 Tax=Halorhodospira halochloris TaxID=1052 RepID=A0A110B4V7_HALHR|nr:tRNA (adenosine(37)-N6)-dimethylallyltransferase MiaA [Halorhodospira halochloris]MBK1651545.1 tRNA (adenosine(37)-N6)-dimethylallyltransferase MiaA [Halorhodospira halochloris]MCG5548756.1 tRNA (adenosine(37)-N6)-dimethylallyltransferase MiaA [Halorhodospira halochloris]BAU57190.1 tRNA dimethylallyltransferase [Halorhodospira halochloris]
MANSNKSPLNQGSSNPSSERYTAEFLGDVQQPRPGVVFLMGPTAVGKSDIAIELARRLPVEIVSVDSAQVYRGLDIGTAKPGVALRREVAHHLIDLRDPAEPYSAADFVQDAQQVVAQIRARARVPLFVGGTGLYFQALEQGLSPMPGADQQIRQELEAEAARCGLAHLHQRLAEQDPETAQRLHPNDAQRIQRALEVHRLTGRPMSEIQRQPGVPGLAARPLKIALQPVSRAWLHERIEQRFRAMLAAGLVGEVLMLYRRADLGLHLPALRAVGYRQVWQYICGQCAYNEMIRRGVSATRKYAKRQLTWMRRHFPATPCSGKRPIMGLPSGRESTVRERLEPAYNIDVGPSSQHYVKVSRLIEEVFAR